MPLSFPALAALLFAVPTSPIGNRLSPGPGAPLAQENALSPISEGLAKHPLMSRLEFELDDEPTGFLLHIQHPLRESPGHIATVSRIFGRAFGSMGTNMRRMLFDPLGSPGDLSQNLFVCSSEQAYANAKRYGDPTTRNIEFATTLPDLHLVVTYLGVDGVENPDAMYAALHEGATRLLESAHPGKEAIQDLWLFEGLATYFANSAARHLPPGITPAPRSEVLDTMRGILGDPEAVRSLLLTTEGLLGCTDKDRIRAPYLRNASSIGAPLPSQASTTAAFRSHSALLVQFLLHGEGARYRDGFRDYVKLAFENKGGGEVLARSLGCTELAELDEPFKVFLSRVTAGGSSDALTETMARALGAEGTQHPTVLPLPVDAIDWLGFAIGTARLGNLTTALAALEVGTESASAETLERMQRTKLRIETLRTARDAYVTSIVGSKTRLRIHLDGESLSAVVTAVENGVAQLGANDRGITEVALDRILPADIAENLGRRAADFGPAWVPSYGKLLGDDRRWDKDLDESEAEAKQLSEDAAAGFKDLVAAGSAMARLAALARMPQPDDASNARAINSTIAGLLEECGEIEAVRARFEPLRNLSSRAWMKLYEDEGLNGILAGDVTTLDDGRVRIRYDFKDSDQLKDFKDRGDYLDDHRSFEGKSRAESSLTIAKKELVGDGVLCYEHILGFESPMKVAYSIKFGKTKKKNQDAQSSLIMGICDDGHESYVMAYNMFDLEVVDKRTKYTATAFAEGERKLDVKKTHEIELEHDGESTVTLRHQGKEVRTIDAGKRKSGSVFLWMNTEVPISMLSLEIEGKVIDTVLVRMRGEWVARQIKEMGLDG